MKNVYIIGESPVLGYTTGDYSKRSKEIAEAITFIMNEELPSDYEDVVKLANWATKKNILKINLNKLVENACEIGVDHSSLLALIEFFFT